MNCSYCHRRVPTEVDKQNGNTEPEVCLCDHNWLHLPIEQRPTPRKPPMLSLPAKPEKDATQ